MNVCGQGFSAGMTPVTGGAILDPLSITGTPPDAIQGVAWSFIPTLSGGLGGYTVSAPAGLPAGISLVDTSTGELAGTFATPGTAVINLQVTDNGGATASLNATITIAEAGSALVFTVQPSIRGSLVEGGRFEVFLGVCEDANEWDITVRNDETGEVRATATVSGEGGQYATGMQGYWDEDDAGAGFNVQIVATNADGKVGVSNIVRTRFSVQPKPQLQYAIPAPETYGNVVNLGVVTTKTAFFNAISAASDGDVLVFAPGSKINEGASSVRDTTKEDDFTVRMSGSSKEITLYGAGCQIFGIMLAGLHRNTRWVGWDIRYRGGHASVGRYGTWTAIRTLSGATLVNYSFEYCTICDAEKAFLGNDKCFIDGLTFYRCAMGAVQVDTITITCTTRYPLFLENHFITNVPARVTCTFTDGSKKYGYGQTACANMGGVWSDGTHPDTIQFHTEIPERANMFGDDSTNGEDFFLRDGLVIGNIVEAKNATSEDIPDWEPYGGGSMGLTWNGKQAAKSYRIGYYGNYIKINAKQGISGGSSNLTGAAYRNNEFRWFEGGEPIPGQPNTKAPGMLGLPSDADGCGNVYEDFMTDSSIRQFETPCPTSFPRPTVTTLPSIKAATAVSGQAVGYNEGVVSADSGVCIRRRRWQYADSASGPWSDILRYTGDTIPATASPTYQGKYVRVREWIYNGYQTGATPDEKGGYYFYSAPVLIAAA